LIVFITMKLFIMELLHTYYSQTFHKNFIEYVLINIPFYYSIIVYLILKIGINRIQYDTFWNMKFNFMSWKKISWLFLWLTIIYISYSIEKYEKQWLRKYKEKKISCSKKIYSTILFLILFCKMDTKNKSQLVVRIFENNCR